MQAIYDFLVNLWEMFKEFVQDFVYDIFDVVLSGVEALIEVIPVPELLQSFDPWAWVDPQAAYLFSTLNIGLCFGLIAAGWVIRFAINLIPSWATRV